MAILAHIEFTFFVVEHDLHGLLMPKLPLIELLQQCLLYTLHHFNLSRRCNDNLRTHFTCCHDLHLLVQVIPRARLHHIHQLEETQRLINIQQTVFTNIVL